MKLAAFSAALLAIACSRSAPPDGRGVAAQAPVDATSTVMLPPSATLDPSALVRGDLPTGPEIETVQGRCQICHTLEYVTQQRLSEAQWDKTLTKMQKWGSPITDDEKKRLAPYLAAVWQKDLPDRASPRVPTPRDAVPVNAATK